MKELSTTERQIAESYCHGYTDKEVANVTGKPIWTIRTHKKHIYQKLGISTTHELVLYMVSKFVNSNWNLKELRLKGLSAILTLIIVVDIFNFSNPDFCNVRTRTQLCRTVRVRSRQYE